MSAARRVIVTVDDFGLSVPVNEAVERAHRDGIVTAASLMVAEAASADAVARAHTMPALGVGLHLVLVAGTPVLPPERVSALVDADGQFTTDLARAGVTFFFHPQARAQLRAEIEAQFAAFAATGLPFDHVNAQCHMHLHPTVLGIVLDVAKQYGSPPMRVPFEPFGPSYRAGGDLRNLRFANAYLLGPWLGILRGRLRRAGVAHNDSVFGLSDVGHMNPRRVRALLAQLPPGDTEVFFHAATGRWDGIEPALRDYELEGEFAALIDPAIAAQLDAAGVRRVPFSALRTAAAP